MPEYLNCEITDNDPSEIIFGCTNPFATNYNPEATVDDGSCTYVSTTFSGCTDPYASNYSSSASVDDGSCIYLDCPSGTTVTGYYDSVTGEFIESPSGVYYIQLESGEIVSLPFRCCNEIVVGQPVYWNPDTKSCINPAYVECPNPTILTSYSNGVDEPVYVITDNFGQPVTEQCCSYLEDAYWNPEFNFNPSNANFTQKGVCISTQIVLECNVESSDLVFNTDGTINVATPIGEIITGTNIVESNKEDSICVNINNWYVFNPWPQGDPINGYPEGSLLILRTTDNNAINLQVGQQIALSGMDIVPINNTCYNYTELTTLNLITKIIKILFVPGSNTYEIVTSVYFSTQPGDYYNNLCLENINVSGSGKLCVVYGQPEETITQTNICVNFSKYVVNNNQNTSITQSSNCSFNYQPSFFDDLIILGTTNPEILNFPLCENYTFNQFDLNPNNLYLNLRDNTNTVTVKNNLENSPPLKLIKVEQAPQGYLAYFWYDYFPKYNPSIFTGNIPRDINDQTCYNRVTYTPVFNNIGFLDIINFNFTTTTLYNYSDLSEACCSILGGGEWFFQNGKCYWTDTRDTDSSVVSIGVSETDILIEESQCTTLNVCMSIFLEKPENPECLPEGDVIGTIGIYSGTNINNNILNVTQTTSYSLLDDGYCKWVQICADITGFEGVPFKVRLDLEGLKNCCDYEIYIDDIVVNCVIQDSIAVPTSIECPGYTLRRVIDNKKSWVYNDDQTINRIFAPSADADIPWRYTDYFNQSGVYEKHSKLVLNSKEMELTFNLCDGFNCTTGTTLSVYDLVNYKNNFQNFWLKFIEQFIPATTIFVAGEKWCTSDKNICPVIEVCDYDNNFDLSNLGISSIENDKEKIVTKESFSDKPPVFSGVVNVSSDKTGGTGTNKTKPPLLLDGFVGVFIEKEPNILSDRRLTLPTGLLPLLETGMDNFRSKMEPTAFIQI